MHLGLLRISFILLLLISLTSFCTKPKLNAVQVRLSYGTLVLRLVEIDEKNLVIFLQKCELAIVYPTILIQTILLLLI
jgi:hypothetical protein